MDKRKVREFKDQQKYLAKKIAKALKTQKFSVNYEQQLPSAYTNRKTGKIVIGNSSEFVFPTGTIRKGKKHRIIVIMRFEVNGYNRKMIGKILCRQFSIQRSGSVLEVRTSVNPKSIGNINNIS